MSKPKQNHVFKQYEMEIRPADHPKQRTYAEGFNHGLILASGHYESENAALISALECLYRLAVRSGICPHGESRCEMDTAQEYLTKCGVTFSNYINSNYPLKARAAIDKATKGEAE